MSEPSQEWSYREYFAQVYMTLIGITQATVFTNVADRSYEYIIAKYGSLSNSIIDSSGLLLDVQLQHFAATLVVIVVVTFEYVYFAGVFSRRIRALEIALLLMLGFTENWLAQSAASPPNWWLVVVPFSVVGFLAYVNTWFYPMREIFAGDRRKIVWTKLLLGARIVGTALSACYGALIYASTVSGIIDQQVLSLALLLYVSSFGAAFLLSANWYSANITR